MSFESLERAKAERQDRANKYFLYEVEKEILMEMNLPPKEYQEEIKKLCERLGL